MTKSSAFSKANCGKRLNEQQTKAYLIDMLDAIAEWCDIHNMDYYLSGGTLLGAIRHKGFIPWDDDIDINIARPDLEKMLSVSKGKIGNYMLTKGGEDPFSPACQTYRLYHPDIIIENFQESKNVSPLYHPLFIDICPIDGFPAEEKETKWFCRKQIILRKMLGVSWHPFLMRKSLKYAILNMLFFLPAKIVGYQKWVKMFQKHSQKYKFEESTYIGVTSIIHYLPREKMLKEDYTPTVEVEFEGKKYKAPKNYDFYLKSLYGDYMKLPPKEKQKSDHVFRVYMRQN